MPLNAARRRAAGVCCALLLACTAAHAAGPAGSLVAARGTIVIQRSGEPPRVVARGAALAAGDTINVPAAGFALVVFADDTRIVLRPGTVFRIEAFEADGNGAALFELVSGGLRTLTGAIAKRNPRAVRFRTSIATIGIRGTGFDARLCGTDCAAENSALGASGDAVPGFYAKVRSGGVFLERNGVVLEVPAGRAARAGTADMVLLDTTPAFLEQDPTPLPESDDAAIAAGAPASGAGSFYEECTVDGAPVFGSIAAQVADSGGDTGATFAAPVGAMVASTSDAAVRPGGPAAIRAGAVPAADLTGAGGGGPPPGTRLNANPGRPPGSNLDPGGGGAGAPREYTGNTKRATPAQLSDNAQRYRNEQENAADIVYREQDAVRDHMRATTTEVLKELGREGGDAYSAEFEIARSEGASKPDAARRASAALARAYREVVDQKLVNQLVANGMVDAGSVSGLDPTTALKFGVGLEAGAQRAGLKSGKDLARSLTEAELEALRARLRKNPQDLDGAINDVTRGGFVREFGMAPEQMMENMQNEADAAGNADDGKQGGGKIPAGGSQGGGGTSVLGGAHGEARGNPGLGNSGGNNERPAGQSNPAAGGGNQNVPGTTGGQTSPGAGGANTPRSESPAGGGATPGAGGNSTYPPGDYVSVTTNEDGSYTVTQFHVGDGGAVDRSTSETFTPNPEGGGYSGDAGGHSEGRPPDGDYSVTYGEKNADGSTNISVAPVGGGDGGNGEGQNTGNGNQNDGNGGQNDQQNQDGQGEGGEDQGGGTAECSGETCNEGGGETSEGEAAPAESTDEGGGGRPNPMADDPVDTAMEIYLDVMFSGGRGTRQQLRAIEVAAGGGATNPGDDPNATGAGDSTSFNLDLKNIGVKAGGGVDGTRAEQDPESFNPLDMDLINLRSGGAVTDPPREGEGGSDAAPVVVGAGGTPGVVGPVPALRESEGGELAPHALDAAIETSSKLRNSGAR